MPFPHERDARQAHAGPQVRPPRSRRLPLALVAAVVVAGCSGDGSGTTAPPTVPTTQISTTQISTTPVPTTTRPPSTSSPTTSSPTTGPTSTVPGDPTTTGPEPDPADEAFAAFETWVGNIADGDLDAAWAGMAPTSRQAVGEEAFFGLASAMSEGWGAWSVADITGYEIGTDEAGRTVIEVSGTVTREGMTETTTAVLPFVVEDGVVLLSPFEEFGNVAEGIREEVEGVEAPPVPPGSGEGRRVVYSNPEQRVWLVEADGSVVDSYLVSGKQGVPAPGTYEVFSRSETAFAGHDDITMRYMVRFAHGRNLAIGFHSIPSNGNGDPLQSEEALGEYHSAGCVRQSLAHAEFLYDWAPEGTAVVVLG